MFMPKLKENEIQLRLILLEFFNFVLNFFDVDR